MGRYGSIRTCPRQVVRWREAGLTRLRAAVRREGQVAAMPKTGDELRVFSLDEANALIPKMELIMGRLQRFGIALREAIEAAAAASDVPLAEGDLSDLLLER